METDVKWEMRVSYLLDDDYCRWKPEEIVVIGNRVGLGMWRYRVGKDPWWHPFPYGSLMRSRGPDLEEAAQTCQEQYGWYMHALVVGRQIHLIGEKFSHIVEWRPKSMTT